MGAVARPSLDTNSKYSFVKATTNGRLKKWLSDLDFYLIDIFYLYYEIDPDFSMSKGFFELTPPV